MEKEFEIPGCGIENALESRMNVQLKHLIELQEIDREIAECQGAIARIPGQLESAQAGMRKIEEEQKQAHDVIDELKKKRHQLEMDVQAEHDHMARTKQKLPTVKTNKEYSAILSEVDAVKVKIARFEDEELAIMETLEEKEKELPGIDARFKEEQAEYNAYKAKKEAEAERAKRDLETLIAKRTERIGTIEPQWARSYEKVLKAREGRAVVPMQDSVCQGCFQQILPQMVVDIRKGEIIHQCSQCSRFLYFIPKPEAEAAEPLQS